MSNTEFALKYNVELFTISLMVDRAKEVGLNTVSIDSPLFRIGYDDLSNIAHYLSESKNYTGVRIEFHDRRNAPHPSGRYSEKTLTLHWED